MHVVIWTSKGQRYATASSSLVEVIPIVQSRPMPASEPWLTGLFDYRGTLLPLFDSSRLLGHDACNVRMSSRILVISVPTEETESPKRLGLMVEHVLGAERLDFDADADSTPSPADSPELDFLGPVVITATGTVQLTAPERLPTAKYQY